MTGSRRSARRFGRRSRRSARRRSPASGQRKACGSREQQAVITNGHGKNPWRRLAAARHRQSCARNGAVMEEARIRNSSRPISARCATASPAAARAAGRAGRRGHAGRGQQDPARRGGARRARRRPARLRREPGAGGAGEISGSCASEFPDLDLHLIGPLQTNKVRDAVAHCDVIETRRPAAPRRGAGARDGAHRPPAALLHRGQYRRGAAEGRRLAGRRRRLHRATAATGSACRSPG